jgi:hypothetical protein
MAHTVGTDALSEISLHLPPLPNGAEDAIPGRHSQSLGRFVLFWLTAPPEQRVKCDQMREQFRQKADAIPAQHSQSLGRAVLFRLTAIFRSHPGPPQSVANLFARRGMPKPSEVMAV